MLCLWKVKCTDYQTAVGTKGEAYEVLVAKVKEVPPHADGDSATKTSAGRFSSLRIIDISLFRRHL
jgi:hypothetical protein